MDVYSRIMLTLKMDQEEICTKSSNDWSDGAMWIRLLEAGEARNRRTTILNMLEYMGCQSLVYKKAKNQHLPSRCISTSLCLQVQLVVAQCPKLSELEADSQPPHQKPTRCLRYYGKNFCEQECFRNGRPTCICVCRWHHKISLWR